MDEVALRPGAMVVVVVPDEPTVPRVVVVVPEPRSVVVVVDG